MSDRTSSISGPANDRGVTLIEYVLVFTSLVLVTAAGAKYLQANANQQVSMQANCISTRPPPASCQVRAISTTTTLVPPPTTATTAPPPPSEASWTSLSWPAATGLAGTLKVTTSAGSPIQGAQVFLKVTCTPSGNVLWPTAFTDASGNITISPSGYNSCPTSDTSAVVMVVRIDSSPGVSPLPSDQTVTKA